MAYTVEFWKKIEDEYRLGNLPVRQISIKFGITEKSINNKARAQAWEREIQERIRAKTRNIAYKRIADSKDPNITEDEIIKDVSEKQADLLVNHREMIGRHQSLSENLLSELEIQTNNVELLEQLGEVMDDSFQTGKVDKLNELYRKVITFHSRIDSAKKLADTIKTMVGLERQAFGISDDADGNNKKPADIIQVYIPDNGR